MLWLATWREDFLVKREVAGSNEAFRKVRLELINTAKDELVKYYKPIVESIVKLQLASEALMREIITPANGELVKQSVGVQ